MSSIPADLVAELARVFHRIELTAPEAAAIARALEPVEAAAEAHAGNLTFESEPSHFDRMLKAAL
jgi:hypothetical protein